MRYIKVECVNKDCSMNGATQTIRAGETVADGVMRPHTHLECVACGSDIKIERV